MPNWTYNYIDLDGREESIKALLHDLGINEQAQKPAFDFNHLDPEPDDLMDRPMEPCSGGFDYQVPAWLNWRRKHWGTKWNASEFVISADAPGHRTITFLTAWDAPRPICQKACDLANENNVYIAWEADHEGDPETEVIIEHCKEADYD